VPVHGSHKVPLIALLLASLITAVSFGGQTNTFSGNAIPTGQIYPNPVGILFPGFNVAAGVNPAALATGKKNTAFQISGSPALQGGDATNYMASIATSSQSLGWSLGYNGSSSGGALTHSLFSGVGFNIGAASLGLGLRGPVSGGFDPKVDFALVGQLSQVVSIGAVTYDLNGTPQTAIGLGLSHKKKDNIELDVLLPSWSNFSGTYVVTFSATVYSGVFGTTFRTSYDTQAKSVSATLGGLVWLFNNMNFIVQLNTPRTLTAALTYVF
jgi:hypothetical protein